MIETISYIFGPVLMLLFWLLLFTTTAGFLYGAWLAYPLYGVIIILSFSKADLYRILMTIMLSINALAAASLTVFINLYLDRWEFYEPIEILEIGVTTVLLTSSLIRIRGLLKKWRAWIISLMIINAVFLLFLVKDAATAAMSV